MKNKIVLCAVSFLAGIILGIAVKKTSTPLFSWGNNEIDIKTDQYK